MKIKVQVKQYLDDQVVIDDVFSYCVKEDFLDALQYALGNWLTVTNGHTVVKCYSELIAPGLCFYGTTTNSDEFERWEIISIE